MAFQVGSNIFVHADATLKMIPLEGERANQPFTFRSSNKLEAKTNGKAITAMGSSIIPVAVVMASAEPSFAIGLDVAQESVDYIEHCGSGYKRMAHNIIITCTRPGLQPVTFKLFMCIIENGFDLNSAQGAQLKDDLSGKMRNLVLTYKGQNYDPFLLPGGVNVS